MGMREVVYTIKVYRYERRKNMKKKKILALFLVAAMTVSVFTACGQADSGSNVSESASDDAAGAVSDPSESASDISETDSNVSEGVPSQTLVIGSNGTAMTKIDRWDGTGVPEDDTSFMIFDYLVWSDHAQNFTPMLATSWEESDDHLTFTFHLREDAYFTDGTQETSADVKASFERPVQDETLKDHSTWLGIASMECPDDFTFVLTLNDPMPTFWDELARVPIISKAAFEADPDNYLSDPAALIAAGPYKLEDFDKTTGEATVVYNSDWWGWSNGFSTNVGTITYKTIAEESTRVAALQAGNIDVAYGLSLNSAQQLENDGNVTVEQVRSDIQPIIQVNCGEGSPFADKNMRLALSYAIDRETIVNDIVGCGYAMDNAIFETYLGYTPNYEYAYKYDPDLAEQCLEEAGYDGSEIVLTYSPDDFSQADEIAQAIQYMANAVGFNVVLNSVDGAQSRTLMDAAAYDIMYTGWGNTSGDPYKVFTMWAVDKWNNQYDNDEFLDLCQRICDNGDREERIQLMEEAFQIVTAEVAPRISLYQQATFVAYDSGISGINFYADGSAALPFVTRE